MRSCRPSNVSSTITFILFRLPVNRDADDLFLRRDTRLTGGCFGFGCRMANAAAG